MNRLWVVPCLCLLMLAAAWYPAEDAARYQQYSEAQLQKILHSAEVGQWPDAHRHIQSLLTEYGTYARRAGWYASDERLYAVRDALWDMEAYARTVNPPEFASACARFHTALQGIVQEQQLTLAGIL